MSYIRSLSNPEQLYIWGDENTVYITKGPVSIGTIPTNIFEGLIKKYIRGYQEDCTYKKATIEEVTVDKFDKEVISLEGLINPMSEFKMKLSYNNWSLIMWDVTWYYIAKSNYSSIIKKIKDDHK